MVKRAWRSIWAKSLKRGMAVMRKASKASRTPRPVKKAVAARKLKPAVLKKAVAPGAARPGMTRGLAAARRFHLYRPDGLRPGERVPLLVMLHGCGQDAAGFAASTRMNAIGARERFIVLYPQQERLANAQGCWNWFETKSGRAQGELALIMAAIDKVCTLYPADRDRVAVAGFSAGASMAAMLAARHPDHFKAVVMHSGVPPGMAHSTLTALSAMRGRRAAAPLPTTTGSLPPLLVIHGTSDHVVAPSNGRAAARLWAEALGARPDAPRLVQRGKRYVMTLNDFKSKGRAMATLAEISGLGHAWSGGAASQPFSDARGPDASRMVWAFAARQFRR